MTQTDTTVSNSLVISLAPVSVSHFSLASTAPTSMSKNKMTTCCATSAALVQNDILYSKPFPGSGAFAVGDGKGPVFRRIILQWPYETPFCPF